MAVSDWNLSAQLAADGDHLSFNARLSDYWPNPGEAGLAGDGGRSSNMFLRISPTTLGITAILGTILALLALAFDAHDVASNLLFALLFSFTGIVVDRLVLDREHQRQRQETKERESQSGEAERRAGRLNFELDALKAALRVLGSPRLALLRAEAAHRHGDVALLALRHAVDSVKPYCRLAESEEVVVACQAWESAVVRLVISSDQVLLESAVEKLTKDEEMSLQHLIEAVESAMRDRVERLY